MFNVMVLMQMTDGQYQYDIREIVSTRSRSNTTYHMNDIFKC